MREFTCEICRQVLPVSELAAEIVARGGGSPRRAIETLPEYDLLCQVCQDAFDELVDETWDDSPPGDEDTLDYYLRMVDRDSIDRVTLDWLQQNY